MLTQEELNDLVRDLELSKAKAELLRSRLKQWNLLKHNVRVTSFRTRHEQLEPYFRKEDDLVFCSDVDGLMNALGIKHDPQKWRLFIDSSKLSLKAVLLHNGNQLPTCCMYILLYYIRNYCGFLRNRSQFCVFIVIFVFSTLKSLRNGYFNLRGMTFIKICCPV